MVGEWAAINKNNKRAIMSKYTVFDTFNKTTVSAHRSLEAAAKSERRFLRAVKRANGSNSYIPTEIRKDGEPLWTDLDQYALTEIRMNLDKSGR